MGYFPSHLTISTRHLGPESLSLDSRVAVSRKLPLNLLLVSKGDDLTDSGSSKPTEKVDSPRKYCFPSPLWCLVLEDQDCLYIYHFPSYWLMAVAACWKMRLSTVVLLPSIKGFLAQFCIPFVCRITSKIWWFWQFSGNFWHPSKRLLAASGAARLSEDILRRPGWDRNTRLRSSSVDWPKYGARSAIQEILSFPLTFYFLKANRRQGNSLGMDDRILNENGGGSGPHTRTR